MIDKNDDLFLQSLIDKEQKNPTHRHILSSYESNYLNVSKIFQIDEKGNAVMENKEYFDNFFLWLENSHDSPHMEAVKKYMKNGNRASKEAIQKEWFKKWVGAYLGSDCITLGTEEQFKAGEMMGVMLEQLNSIDFEYGVTFRKSIFHKHDFFEIIYVFRGSCTTTISGVPSVLKEGDICIYNLQAVHQLGVLDEKSAVFNVLIHPTLLSDLFTNLMGQNDPLSAFFINSIFHIASPGQHLVFHRDEKYDCELYICKIIAEYYKGQTMAQNMMTALLIPFFTSLSRCQQDMAAQNQTLNRQNESVNAVQIITYINEHAETITLKALAEHFQYAPRTMIRLIQNYTHRKFSDIVREFRLKHACDLLSQTEMPVSEIAIKIGYCERSYFDTLFKAHYHKTPVEYRRAMKPLNKE